MKIRFWGARGSFVAAGPQFVRYGGNTPCVELTEGEHRLIFDLGSGAIPLGRTLPPKNTHVLLSHTHIDHIQGFPFFAPVFNPAAKLVIHGPRGAGKKIERVLDESLNPDYSPLYSLSNLSAKLDFQHLGEEPLVIDGFDVTSAALPHGRIVSWGFRVEGESGTVAYLTDVEYGPHGAPESAVTLARDADLLIHDATYTPDDYPPRAGWGHCSWEHALTLAERAGAKKLALFHHEPDRTDDEVDVIVAMARNAAGKGTAIIGATEGEAGIVDV